MSKKSPKQALIRHYRPKNFREVVGQEAIVQTLKNSIEMDRLANAYLFCGSHGTGKTTLARLFAKALNCQALSADHEPCNQCTLCKEIDLATSMDVLEIDGASHRGIEDIRQINETCTFVPAAGHYKIYLIDEVHMLTKEAFNALLKTLEEPPEKVKFFFATTEAHKLPATIISRCQRFNLKRIGQDKIVEKLSQIASDLEIEAETAALHKIARFSKGGMRDAESLFDQLIVFNQGIIDQKSIDLLLGLPEKELFFTLDRAQLQDNVLVIFEISQKVIEAGTNLPYFLLELTEHFRTLLLLKSGGAPELLDSEERTKLDASAKEYELDQLLTIINLLHEAQATLSQALSERIWLEQLLLKLLQSKQRLTTGALVQKLIELEKRLEGKQKEPVVAAIPQPKPKVAKKAPVAPVAATAPTPAVKPAPAKAVPATKKAIKKSVSAEKKVSAPTESLQEQSRHDTLMRFAAKELTGSLKTT